MSGSAALLVGLAVGSGMAAGPAEAFTVQSASFKPGGEIGAQHAMAAVKGGANRSVEVHWSTPPKGTKSLVLAMIDLHPIARQWIHWLVVDIPASLRSLPEGASGHLPGGAKELVNGFGPVGYGGPQPPPGSGVHRYELTVYALSASRLPIKERDSWPAVEKAMQGHVLARAAVIGTFER